MKAPRHIYVTADRSRVVEVDDPEARVLLFAAGDEIPEAEAKRLGLKDKPEPAAEAPSAEAKAVGKGDPGVEDKALPGPKARKAGK